MQFQSKFILPNQIRISVDFTHVRKFYLSYPYQPMGKTKNEKLHVGHKLAICDVIVMLKWRHHVLSQWNQDFLEAFFMFVKY